MNMEDLLVKCKHGNRPNIIEIGGKSGAREYRAECEDCTCGHKAQMELAPRWAATRWHRRHHGDN